jgi:hypothetical protein
MALFAWIDPVRAGVPPLGPHGYRRLDLYASSALHDARLTEVNRALRANGYTLMRERALTLGLGLDFAFLYGRLSVDGEFDVYGRKAYQNSTPVRWSEARFGVAAGPDVPLGGGFVAPLVGFSMATDSLHFTPGQAPFLVEQVGESVGAVSHDSTLLDVAVALDYPVLRGTLPSRGTTERISSALLLGLRLGYHWQVFATDWYVGPTNLSPAPALSLSGWFLRVLVGWQTETLRG